MAYINFDNRQDMQDDTYKIVALNIAEAIFHIKNLDVKAAHRVLDSLTRLMCNRLKGHEALKAELSRIKNVLYRIPPPQPRDLSKAMDDTAEVFEEIARQLDQAGILLRAETNTEELYKRGGRG